jgi:NADPH:quinone reductase-like Zn-dependent oxidoreductase
MWTCITRGDGIAQLALVDRPEPVPGPHDVLVAMRAVSLNYRDLLVVKGVADWKPDEPRVPLSDGVGTVVAIGSAVTRVRVGERVAGIFLPHWRAGELDEASYIAPLGGAKADGVLSQYRLFDEQSVVRVPHHLSDTEAATLPVAAVTAWHAVRRRARVKRGDVVLIEGTGGVSLFATQFVHAAGGQAIVLSRSDAKLVRAREAGAAATLNTTRHPDWEREVRALTDGRGVDVVIEVVGGEHLNRALEAVRIGGTICFIGLMAGLSAPINTYRFVTRNVQLHGIETGSREMFEEMNAMIELQRLRPIIDRSFDFPDLAAALRELERGAHAGKIVMAL